MLENGQKIFLEMILFVEFMENMETAVARARMAFPGQTRTLVFPYAGVTYPIIQKG
jgi:hypothetical protein